MKLNEKIACLRQEKGWSQEELAEKLEVSRQSISKWESGASTPELERIVKLCALFDTTADALINDEIELNAPAPKPQSDVPMLTLDGAYEYLSAKQSAVQRLAWGVAACVASPIPAVLTEGLSVLEGLGVVVLLAMVAWAVWQFILYGSAMRAYAHIERGKFAPTEEARRWAEQAREEFRPRLTREIAFGVALCILSCAPFVALDAVLEFMPTMENLCAAALLGMVAAGCQLFVHSGAMQGAYARLSKEAK